MADPQIIPFPQQPLRAPSVAPLLAFDGVSIRRGAGWSCLMCLLDCPRMVFPACLGQMEPESRFVCGWQRN